MLQSSWSFTLCTIRGIPIRIHYSFLLFLTWIIVHNSSGLTSLEDRFIEAAFVLAIFTCVLLHELGHVFMARYFSITARDIVLYPFGGIAMLSKAPHDKEELFIAIAGPLVNFVIAFILWSTKLTTLHPLLEDLFETNIFIGIFNLIPAIPMDGGRILRAILSMLKLKSATNIAAKISQACSVLMGIAGIYFGSAMLCIIAIVVFFGALQESLSEHTNTAAVGKRASDFLVERSKLYEFTHGTALSDALPIAMKALQDTFPVLYHGKLLGMISRSALIDAATSDPSEQYLSSLMQREFTSVTPDRPLIETLAIAQQLHLSTIPVITRDEEFLGFIFPNHITDFMVVDTIREDQKSLHAELDSDDFL